LNQKKITLCCGRLMASFAPEDEATKQIVDILG
jgi:hypothetical protein